MMDEFEIRFTSQTFHFKKPAGTSRGVLHEKPSWFLEIWRKDRPNVKGTGECSVIPGLSPDYVNTDQYEQKLAELCNNPSLDLSEFPSIKFGLESALLDVENGGKGIYFRNEFSAGERQIPINGLIWMGSYDFMLEQIEAKLNQGFRTIKMKVGAIDFDKELKLLATIRNNYSKEDITLRVDANGAFSPEDVRAKLKRLAEMNLHSIEQPIAAGQKELMAELCAESAVPIALDEELIGVNNRDEKIALLDAIKPAYLVLKPSLHGGISGSREWIELAESGNIAWWLTSALESNVGLNVICQFCAEYTNNLPQGLGTGGLYTNNLPSRLHVENGYIRLLNA